MANKMMRLTSRIVCMVLVLVMVFSCIPGPAFAEEENDDPFIVVSLGDSYSSGEGIPDFYGPVKSPGESEEDFWKRRLESNDFLAHRSLASWPGQLKFQELPDDRTIDHYRVPEGQTSNADIQWYFVAASGAVSKDFYEQKQDKDYKRTVGSWGNKKVLSGTKYLPIQLDVFNNIDGASVDYVTFTIGGNDLGFVEVVEKAAKKSTYLGNTELNTMLKDRWDKVDSYLSQLKTTYEKVAAKAPNAEIIVVGYPRLFENTGKGWLISEAEAVNINTKVSQFNGKIKDLINTMDENSNLHFVSVEETFRGHEAYSSDAWINKIYITAKDDDLEENKPSSHSMHPTAKGAQKYAECVNKKIVDIESKGTLAGKICKASDMTTPIPEATIHVMDNESTLSLQPDSNGQYSVDLPVDGYHVKVTADGYIEFNAYANIEARQTVYMETFLMVEGEETDIGTSTGRFTNALTGQGVEGITLEVRKGWNNTTIGEVLTTVTTDASGEYMVTLPIGNYTLSASKGGFISTMLNIIVQKDVCTRKDGSITPIISGDSFRIILDWGMDPQDLDSHVIGTLSDGSSFEVAFWWKSQYDGEVETCNLDLDDVDGEGPETITLNVTTDQPYYYFVHRYSGFGSIATSNARVNVYQGANHVMTFNAPTNLGDGDIWNVFAIVDGQMVISNTITDYADTGYANGSAAVYGRRMPDRVEPVNDPASYPAKEETMTEKPDVTEETAAATEPEMIQETVSQVETRTVYLDLKQMDRDYTWTVQTADAQFDVTEVAEGIYAVELPAGTQTIRICGANGENQISSGEISLTKDPDQNCIVAQVPAEGEREFAIVWGIYVIQTTECAAGAEEEVIPQEEEKVIPQEEEKFSDEEVQATEATESEEDTSDGEMPEGDSADADA